MIELFQENYFYLLDVVKDPFSHEKLSNEHFHSTLVWLMNHHMYNNFVDLLKTKLDFKIIRKYSKNDLLGRRSFNDTVP